MTVQELRELLSHYNGDQEVIVILYNGKIENISNNRCVRSAFEVKNSSHGVDGVYLELQSN